MKINGKNITLTPSEAYWATTAMAMGGREEVARDIVRARRQAIATHLPPGFFEGVVELVRDIRLSSEEKKMDAEFNHIEAEVAMSEAEKLHAVDAKGNELHTVAVTLPEEADFAILREQARLDNEILGDRVVNFDAEMDVLNEAFNADPMVPDDVKNLDPKTAADHRDLLFKDDVAQLQVVSGILAAIDARHLNNG